RATTDITQIQQTSFIAMRMVLFAPIMAVGGIVMVVATDITLSWVIVVAIVAVFVFIGAIMVVAMPKFKIMQTLIDKVNLVARESLTGLPVIRAFNRQQYEELRFDAANKDLMRTQLFTSRIMAFMHPGVQLVMNGTTALIVWVAAGYIDAGTLETGEMIAFITYATVIIMSFMMLSMIAIVLPRANVAAARIDEVLSCPASISDPQHPRDAELGTSAGASLSFENVTFRYDEESEPVLSNVSFSVPEGSTTAIVGATGSGKSTILKLMLRLYDVTEGRVCLDGIDVRELSQNALHRQIGDVPQKSFLFGGSVASNIAYSDPAMPMERIRDAARIAQATEFVDSFEGGYDAAISQGGTNVSGGQRQRLAIARVLATDARAFLFDDSFSALDYATDAALRDSLDRELAGKTRVVVAQRISTIRDSDNIVVVDGGRVVGQGTHGELLDTCAVYREIAASQLSDAELAGGGAA
ncbi:MAG: ABC transporter ATP-binding protein, partial [Eggerthellaceae bacterium]|nr:ABC transporter ATP-binding protein [Eggerthellaceae bacterium]